MIGPGSAFRSLALAIALIAGAFGAIAQEKRPAEPTPPRPVKQPVEFSHKRHTDLGLECNVCHPMADGEQAGIPQTEDCLNCHQDTGESKPAFKALFEHSRAKKQILWTRVYLLPSFVFFGHKAHQGAKDGCDTCHGPVATRDLLWKEREISMKACMDCHKANRASVSCSFCHDLNQ